MNGIEIIESKQFKVKSTLDMLMDVMFRHSVQDVDRVLQDYLKQTHQHIISGQVKTFSGFAAIYTLLIYIQKRATELKDDRLTMFKFIEMTVRLADNPKFDDDDYARTVLLLQQAFIA